jgi:hypothetical protein
MGFNDKEYHQNTAKRLIAMGRDQEAKSIFDMMKEIDPEAKGRDNPLRKFGIMEENGKFFEKGTEYH